MPGLIVGGILAAGVLVGVAFGLRSVLRDVGSWMTDQARDKAPWERPPTGPGAD